QYTSIIQSETERLSTLTKQLLLLTSLDQLKTPLKKVEFQLDEQIREVVRNYQWQVVSKELSLDSELEEIMYYGDPSFLEKVWDNLVSNAVKYTKEGSISITLRQERNEVVFEIKDSGIGIAEEHLPRLFERFYRADASRNKDIEGTGLGLSIVQQVLSLHDGSIEVESEEGKGTLIRVRLQQILKG
ncbi:MAG TPA: ATP-binding protein, partial [Savagea sp.]